MAVPYGTGAALSGFLDAYYRMADSRRRQQLAEDAAMMHDYQLNELLRQSREREAARQIAPKILSAQSTPPETATIRPAVAPVPSLASTLGPEASSEEHLLGIYAPGTIPGRPAVTVSAPTMRSIGQAVGAEGLATAITTPEGQAALKARGVITDEAFDQKKRLADAREKYQEATTASIEALGKGQPLVVVLQQIAGVRAQMAVADPAHVPTLQAKMSRLTEDYLKLQKDADERQRAADDGMALARAMKKPADMIDVIAGFRSERFKKIGDAMMTKVAEGALEDLRYPGLSAATEQFAKLWSGETAAGEKPNPTQLWSTTVRQTPAALLDIITATIHGKKLPDPLLVATFGEARAPRTDIELAHRVVTESRGIKDSDPRYAEAVFGVVRSLKDAERRPEKDTTVADLRGVANEIDKEITRLEAEHRELRSSLPKDIAAMAMLSQADRDAADATRRRMADVIGEIAKRRERFRQVLSDLDRHIAARGGVPVPSGQTAPPSAPPATGQPQPSPPTADQAGPGTDPKRSIPPRPGATRADAVAEMRRLIGQRHTPESAAEAMRQVGWPP